MGIANRIDTYDKKKWNSSKYKPKRAVNVAADITQEITNTCNNLNQLSGVMQNIANELHSSEFSREASQIDYLINEVGKTLSKTSIDIVSDLGNACNLIAQQNDKLSNEMASNKNSLHSCEIQLERFSR